MKTNQSFLKNLPPENIFVFLSLFFGSVISLVTPPFQAPDEHKHLLRAFQISEGHLFAEERYAANDHRHFAESFQNSCAENIPDAWQPKVGAVLPRSLWTIRETSGKDDISFKPTKKQEIEDIFSAIKIPLNGQDRVFMYLASTAYFSPVAYIPQAFGVLIGRELGLPPLILMYCARLSNLFCWTFLVFVAIRAIPVFKWVLFLLALMPMSLFQASSVSADSLTNGLSFLFIAFFLKIFLESKGGVKGSEVFIFSLLLTALFLSKQGYAPLLALLFLIPQDRFGGFRKKIATIIIIGGVSGVLFIIWNLHVQDIYIARDWTNPNEQLFFIVGNPLEYAHIFLSTLSHEGKNILFSFIGVLGYLDTNLPTWLYGSYCILLLSVSFLDSDEKMKFQLWHKTVLGTIFLIEGALIATMAYLHWSPFQSEVIRGIQGRYFIPIGLLFLLLFYTNRRFRARKYLEWVPLYSFAVLTTTCLSLLRRYY